MLGNMQNPWMQMAGSGNQKSGLSIPGMDAMGGGMGGMGGMGGIPGMDAMGGGMGGIPGMGGEQAPEEMPPEEEQNMAPPEAAGGAWNDKSQWGGSNAGENITGTDPNMKPWQGFSKRFGQ